MFFFLKFLNFSLFLIARLFGKILETRENDF